MVALQSKGKSKMPLRRYITVAVSSTYDNSMIAGLNTKIAAWRTWTRKSKKDNRVGNLVLNLQSVLAASASSEVAALISQHEPQLVAEAVAEQLQ